ncbi:hypothetical protein [Aurantiacibacter marinus]|uniref:Uncharacterized protein n=1 Tax=Aurantiacibacter marinus TaxID=874156 RepID=A0A0H0XWY5_9SPHN|nr:hypothetical protein [Aurantiacibacter marinus]KLI64785.1 hypothetical protein AAV99_04500 [Aurantiacibacter marinus]
MTMFEGKPPIASGAHCSQHDEIASEELCAIDWAELTAKLAAARDLRRELASGDDGIDDGTMASFDAHCALHLASHHGKFPDEASEENNKRGVNPDDLANGKGACAIVGRHAENGDPANRGNT